MADDTEKRLARLAELQGKLREAHARCYELLEEMTDLLKAEPTKANHVRTLFGAFQGYWTKRYGEKYVFASAKDAVQFKRLLRTLPVEEIIDRMERYVASHDPFHVRARHNLNVFVASINSLGRPPEPQGWLCRHDPPCPIGTTAYDCDKRTRLEAGRRKPIASVTESPF
jgi:hypothetical protein